MLGIEQPLPCTCVSSIHVEALQKMRQTPNPAKAEASSTVAGDCGCGGCGCSCDRPTLTLTFFVGGMTCASCAQRLTTALGRVRGVITARVSFLSQQANIVVDSAQSGAAAVAAVDCVLRMGYTMLGGERPCSALRGEDDDGDTTINHNSTHSITSMATDPPNFYTANTQRQMAREGSRLSDTAFLVPLSSNEESDSDEDGKGSGCNSLTSYGDAHSSRSSARLHEACNTASSAATSSKRIRCAAPAAVEDTPAFARTRLLIEGMSCTSCAARVERELQKRPGVREVMVNFAVMSGRVLHDAHVMSATDLADEVRALGYRVTLQGSHSVTPTRGLNPSRTRRHNASLITMTHSATNSTAAGKRGAGPVAESGISIVIDRVHGRGAAGSTKPASTSVRNGDSAITAKAYESNPVAAGHCIRGSTAAHAAMANGADTAATQYVHRFLIEGMSCASCAARIERTVCGLPMVSDAVVSFTTGTAAVTTTDDVVNDNTAVRDLIASLGYGVTPLRDRARRACRPQCKAYNATGSRHSGENAVTVDRDDRHHRSNNGALTVGDAVDEIDGDRTRAALERKHEIQHQRASFVNSAILSVPLVIAMLIMSFTDLLEASLTIALFVDGVQMLCATPIVFMFGRQFFTVAWRGLQQGAFTMDTLVAIGTGCSYVYSAIAFIISALTSMHMTTYFDTAGMLTTFMLLGRFLEASAKRNTSGALIELMSLVPAIATVVTADGDIRVASVALQVGDHVRVLAGDRVPVDGTIVGGLSDIDEQLVTGESVPKACRPGDRVVGGTLNVTATLLVEVDKVGEDTLLSQILRIVQDAQNSKPAVQRIADRVAMYFVPFVVLSSLITLVVWLVAGFTGAYPASWRTHSMSSTAFAFNFFIATVVVACPCALGLATPTAIMVGTGVGAQNGVLVKSGVTLESVRKTDCVVFDKTGTITNGQLRVTWARCFHVATGAASSLVHQLVGAVESQSTHPIAKAVAAEVLELHRAEAEKGPWTTSSPVTRLTNEPVSLSNTAATTSIADNSNASGNCSRFDRSHRTYPQYHQEVSRQVDVMEAVTHPGRGVEATVAVTEIRVDGQFIQQYKLLVGSLLFLQEQYVTVSRDVADAVQQRSSRGETTIVAAVDGTAVFVAALADEPKIEAFGVMAHLHKRGIRTLMVTGDNRHVAAAVARSVGISFDSIRAEALPSTKAEIVQSLQAEGHHVMFVGDGINDSPALAQADVGVALGAGTEVAIEAADAVLVRNSLADLLSLMRLSDITVRRIYGNFVWAFAYNLIMLPLASGLLYPVLHLQLPPVVAGAAMVLSSLSVLASSLSIRCFKPCRPAQSASGGADWI